MHYIFSKIHMPFVYGPLTEEEANSIPVAKSMVPEVEGYYVGTHVELPDMADKKVFKWVPPVLEEG